MTGRKFFHIRCINWSYRNRGYDARTHTKIEVNRAAFSISIIVESCGKHGQDDPKNRITDKVFIIIILAYSAKKKRAKGPAAYSTLKPDTSSDSPSVKSKGARFVSARVDVNHI